MPIEFFCAHRYGPISAEEFTLSANQIKSEQEKNKIRWNTYEGSKKVPEQSMKDDKADSMHRNLRATNLSVDGKYEIELKPMQIKTFIVNTA